jgi:hypothetical protein
VTRDPRVENVILLVCFVFMVGLYYCKFWEIFVVFFTSTLEQKRDEINYTELHIYISVSL